MVEAFDFEEGGRTYSCKIERQKGSIMDGWWWFIVSGDGHRYAPFQAARGDTQTSVRTRILEYHMNRLARRAAPPVARNHWGKPRKDAPPPADGQPGQPGQPGQQKKA
ncbi:MAG TPA: hypothetical protein VGI92_07670 [Gemmatimonadales bacterium]|jgi:hypothetical protein